MALAYFLAIMYLLIKYKLGNNDVAESYSCKQGGNKGHRKGKKSGQNSASFLL